MDKITLVNCELPLDIPIILKKENNRIGYIKLTKDENFTGQLRLNFHKGNLSEKVEKKENIYITLPPPQAKGER